MPSADDFQIIAEAPLVVEDEIAFVTLWNGNQVRAKVVGFYEGLPVFDEIDYRGKVVPRPRITTDQYITYERVEE